MSSLFCPVCGTENPTTRQFCRKCASDLRAPVPVPAQVPAQAPTQATARTSMGPIAIGGGVALIGVVIVIGLMVMLGSSPAASPSPVPAASPAATAAATAATETSGPTQTATPVATKAPTPKPTAASTQAPGTKPTVDKFSGPRTASCTEANGTAPVGQIRLTWVTSNATGVRLSIDPPTVKTAYDYLYEDYGAVGAANVPFTCDPPKSDANGPYHLYVVTTLHDTGYYSYRYVKVYQRT